MRALRPTAVHLGLDPLGSVVGHLVHRAMLAAVRAWFAEAAALVARADGTVLRGLWRALSATTAPVLDGAAFHGELSVMATLAATAALPLLAAAAIYAVVRQEPGALVRTVAVRLPLALLFTSMAVELVSLGLAATDQASASLLAGAGRPLHVLFGRLVGLFGGADPLSLAPDVIFLLLAGVLGAAVWLELAVRAAAVAVATLFLPLALVGSTFPATAHWGRRLAETITALVLSKLVIVAVLALAVSALGGDSGGLSALVEGVTLLGLAAVAPFALARLVPMVEAGAVEHLSGAGRQVVSRAATAASSGLAWLPAGGVEAAEGLGRAIAGHTAAGTGSAAVPVASWSSPAGGGSPGAADLPLRANPPGAGHPLRSTPPGGAGGDEPGAGSAGGQP